MSKIVVEIVCILDRSGSMSRLVEETISGYNKFIKEQQQIGPGRVTLVLFDDQYEMVYEDMALSSVSDLTTEVYYTRGMTRLHDAVGKNHCLCQGTAPERHTRKNPVPDHYRWHRKRQQGIHHRGHDKDNGQGMYQ